MRASLGASGLRVIVRSMISGSAKTPMVVAMSGKPDHFSHSCSKENLKSRPSGPTALSSMPKIAAAMPLTIAPPLSAATIATPKIAMAPISANPNASTKGVMTGMMIASANAPTTPPIAETA